MRVTPHLLLLALLFATPVFGADGGAAEAPAPVALEFAGYRFGQSPSANMICFSGFCKSQAPGGDGLVTFPFSIYETPGVVSTFSGLMLVNPRYTFWNDRLFRIVFQVDCTPLETGECLDDIVRNLDRKYTLTPLLASDVQQFTTGKRVIVKQFATDSGASVKIRTAIQPEVRHKPIVDIVDQGMANLVGSTLNPAFKPKTPVLQDIHRKP